MTMIESEVVNVVVRSMNEGDLAAVVRIDAASAGRARPGYFELMMQRAVKQAGLMISLVAETDGRVIGFLIGSLYYGEYVMTEPSASIDAIGVEPDSRRSSVAHDLLAQLRRNVAAIGAASIRTEVDWNRIELLAFLHKEGFLPAPRLCLERKVDPTEGG